MSLLAILILLLVNIFNTISTNSPKVLLYQQFSQITLDDQLQLIVKGRMSDCSGGVDAILLTLCLCHTS